MLFLPVLQDIYQTSPDIHQNANKILPHFTQGLKNALDSADLSYEIAEGEGAFYGPKIEFHVEDSLKRRWQCGTVQVDFFQPDNFDLHYITPTGNKQFVFSPRWRHYIEV